jgi:nucleoside-diphosphate-sugar epimerase
LDAYTAVVQQPIFGEIFNIGSGTQSSIYTVVTAIREILGNGTKLVWGAVGTRRPEPELWVANIGKARREFNWKPSTMLQKGLEQTVSWMKNNLSLYP